MKAVLKKARASPNDSVKFHHVKAFASLSSWRHIITLRHRAYLRVTDQHHDTKQHSCSHLSANTVSITSSDIIAAADKGGATAFLQLQKYVAYDSSLF